MINIFNRILVLAPHTDDGELGCGGTISKLISKGAEVFYLAFSAAEDSVPKDFPRDTLRKEAKLSTSCLGIKEKNCLVLDYKVRVFKSHRQEILDDMIKVRNEFYPDLVIVPSSYDNHQDHEVINNEAKRAFKNISIIGYELPWNNSKFSHDLFVELDDKDLLKKIEAVSKYETQKFRKYSSENFLRSLATLRGVQINKEFAESFEVVRLIT